VSLFLVDSDLGGRGAALTNVDHYSLPRHRYHTKSGRRLGHHFQCCIRNELGCVSHRCRAESERVTDPCGSAAGPIPWLYPPESEILFISVSLLTLNADSRITYAVMPLAFRAKGVSISTATVSY
jgi:hypothetical protein